MTHAQNDPLAVAQGLTRALQETSGELAALRKTIDADRKASQERDAALAKYGRLNRMLVIAAIVGFLLDVTATTFAFVAFAEVRGLLGQVERNSATVAQLHETNVSACQSGNAIRAQQEQALDGILTLGPARPGQTPAERRAAAALLARDRARIARGWGPRNCARIYKLGR